MTAGLRSAIDQQPDHRARGQSHGGAGRHLFAWLNFRTNARLGPLASLLPMLPLLLPSVAVTIGWVFLGSDESGFLTVAVKKLLATVGFKLERMPVHIFSWPGLLMLYFLEIMPVVYVIVGAAYRSTDSSLEEAARINGSGVFKTFVTVSVPIVRPAILLSMLLASVLAIGIYSIPAIVGSTAKIPTLSVHLVRLLNGEFPPRIDQAAVISLFLIVVFGAFWVFQQRLNAFARHAQIGGQGLKSASILLSRPACIVARTAMIGLHRRDLGPADRSRCSWWRCNRTGRRKSIFGFSASRTSPRC